MICLVTGLLLLILTIVTDSTQNNSRYACLNSSAVPSLVILGAAKGGTTDVYDMLTTFHSLFNKHRLWQIEKEVNLLAPHLCHKSGHAREYGRAELVADTCSADDVYVMLRCQRQLAAKENLTLCRQFLDKHDPRAHDRHAAPAVSPHLPYQHTITARPSLFFQYTHGARLFQHTARQTHAPSLFLVLLRSPVGRAVSLYNHGQMLRLAQHSAPVGGEHSVGYSLPLEDVLSVELWLMQGPCGEVLQRLATSAQSWDDAPSQSLLGDLKQIGVLFDELQRCMSGQLKLFNTLGSREYPLPRSSGNGSSSGSSSHRVNLRPFGLLAEGLYGAQLSGWLGSGLFQGGRRAEALSRVLIAQSELLFRDRFHFFNRVLLPFLHPVSCAQPAAMARSVISSDTSSDPPSSHSAGPHKAARSKISNQKPRKLPSSALSSAMESRLRQFYESHLPVTSLLRALVRLQQTEGGSGAEPFFDIAPADVELWW